MFAAHRHDCVRARRRIWCVSSRLGAFLTTATRASRVTAADSHTFWADGDEIFGQPRAHVSVGIFAGEPEESFAGFFTRTVVDGDLGPDGRQQRRAKRLVRGVGRIGDRAGLGVKCEGEIASAPGIAAEVEGSGDRVAGEREDRRQILTVGGGQSFDIVTVCFGVFRSGEKG